MIDLTSIEGVSEAIRLILNDEAPDLLPSLYRLAAVLTSEDAPEPPSEKSPWVEWPIGSLVHPHNRWLLPVGTKVRSSADEGVVGDGCVFWDREQHPREVPHDKAKYNIWVIED